MVHERLKCKHPVLMNAMPRQAIKQATCEDCNDEDNSFSVNGKVFVQHEPSPIKYDVDCDCGATGIIVVGYSGTHAGRGINHDSASWNETDDSDDTDE